MTTIKAYPKKNLRVNMLSREIFEKIAKVIIYDFKVDEDNKELFELLYLYLTHDQKFFLNHKHHLNKGLLICGNPGTGKTGLMKVLQKAFALTKSPFAFSMATTWGAASEFGSSGYDAFEPYRKKHWFFDELGMIERETVMHYGNKVNVAEALILERYNQFTTNALLTHFTTNLSDDELQDAYDGRTYSRLREMCNIIPLVGKDRRLEKDKKPKPIPLPEPEKPKPTLAEELAFFKKLFLIVVADYQKHPDFRYDDRGNALYNRLTSLDLLHLTPDRMKQIYEEEKQKMRINPEINSLTEQNQFQAWTEGNMDNDFESRVKINCRKAALHNFIRELLEMDTHVESMLDEAIAHKLNA